MPVRYLSDPELARLSGWPDEIADEDAVTCFTLSADDVSWLAGFNRQQNRLGVAVQLSTLPWLGWIPDDLASCPPMALDRLAEALAIVPDTSSTLLTEYGGWQGETRRKHRGLVLERLGWRLCGAGERKLLDEFLLARALEHDAPGVLLRLACDWLRAESIVRPPVDSLTRRIATARDAARAETYHRLGPLLQPPRPMQLDGLLDVDPDLGITRLAWLRRGATVATPQLLKAELEKQEFLRRHGADTLDLSRLPAGRRRMLAEIGFRSTNQALQRADVERRHPVLLATLAETYAEVLDELVQLLDQALAGADSRARHELSQRLVDRAKAEADRARLLDEILDVLADPNVSDADAGRLVREQIGMPRLIAARRPAEQREPRDHGHFDLLAARYKYLRTFTPPVIAALPLTGNTASSPIAALLKAVEVLRDLNAAGRTTVPEDAAGTDATVFVPTRWRSYLDTARGQGRGAAYRHYWELSVLYGVQAGLRSGDLWVPGSRRYTDPATLLLPPDRWAGQRDDFCTVTGSDPNPSRQLERLEAELHAAVAGLETILADPGAEGLARLGADGELIVSPLPAEQVPAEADTLAEATSARLPRVQLPALLIEVDQLTGFSEEFTHAGGAQPRNPELRRNLYASLITYACNLGYAGMADASGISEDAARLDLTVVPAPRDAAGGQHASGQRPPRAPARDAVGRRHAVVLRRAEVPAARPQPDRPSTLAVLPRRRHYHVYPRLRPTFHLWHQSNPDPPGAKPSRCWTRSSATQRICLSASTPSTPPDKPLRRSRSSTWLGCSSPRASETSAASSSTASEPAPLGDRAIRTPGGCSVSRSRPS